MKVILQLIVSRDGYIAWVGDDISWISEKTREQYTRTIRGMGSCIVGRRAWQVFNRTKIIDSRWQNSENVTSRSETTRSMGDTIVIPGKEPESSRAKRDNSYTSRQSQASSSKWQYFFDACNDPFVVVLSKHNYPSQPNRHFTHAKPKNILKLLDEKWYSSTVVCGGIETATLFLDAGVVNMVYVYHEDVDVGEGIKWDQRILWKYKELTMVGWILYYKHI